MLFGWLTGVNVRAATSGRDRLLVVVALLAVAAFGVGGSAQVTLSTDPLRPDGPAELIGLILLDAAWLLAATVVLVRASPTGAVWPALRRAATANAVLVVVAIVLVTRAGGALGRSEPPAVVRFGARNDPWTTHLDLPGLHFLLLALTVLLVATALVGAVIVVWLLVATRDRYLRRRARGVRERVFGRGRRRPADTVLDAIVRARRALRSDDDARRAVIGAYAAMERAIQARGAPRRASQTPAEFLRGALDGGFLHDEQAAARLLRLFELARFSHADLPGDAATVADRELGLLQADLDRITVAR